MWKRRSLVIPALVLTGCSAFAFRNVELKQAPAAQPPPAPVRATFHFDDPRGDRDVVVCLALSGGGSRAAWFSSAVMLELEKVCADQNLLHQVDVISSVSGGSLASAYYCISQDRTAQVKLSAAPGGPVAAGPNDRLAYDPATGFLTSSAPLPADAVARLHSLCAPRDAPLIDRLAQESERAPSGRFWDHDTVRELMTRNYVRRCAGNMFWPTNIALYWTTAFDRGDIMAQTLADNLFDRKSGATSYGDDLTFADLNPLRPHLIINSTDGTDDRARGGDDADSAEPGTGGRFGNVFTFTREDFTEEIKSDIAAYPIAHAVMASASFPGAFPYRTLRDFTAPPQKGPRYVHVFDGGNSDNLGLLSLKKVIRDREREKRPPPKAYVVICIDSYTEPRGADPREADPRSAIDYVVDTDFLDSIDMLLKLNRYHIVSEFMSTREQEAFAAQLKADVAARRPRRDREPSLPFRGDQFEKIASRITPTPARKPTDDDWEPNDLGDRLVFWHITFRDLEETQRPLWHRVNSIATDFKISDAEADDLETAAGLLVRRDRETIARIAGLLHSKPE